MGIRVKKILGYGLEVKVDNHKLVDDRINEPNEEFYEICKTAFINFAIQKIDSLKPIDYQSVNDNLLVYSSLIGMVADLKDGKWNVYDSYHFDAEFGLPLIVFTVPGMKQCYRYDDLIDYYGTDAANPTSFKLLNEIYPYYKGIPPEIKCYCEFIGIFKDMSTVDQLKPMLYTYWS